MHEQAVKNMDQNQVQTFHYGLTRESPILLRSHEYQDLKEAIFDMHYEVELGIVHSGKMKRQYLNYDRILKPGQVWLNGIWEPHGFQLLETPCRVSTLMINPEFLMDMEVMGCHWLSMFQAEPSGKPCIEPEGDPGLLPVIHQMEDLTGHDMPASLMMKKIYLLQLLTLLMDKESRPAADFHKVGTDFDIIRPAIDLVFCSSCHVSADIAAKACTMSLSHFSKAFSDRIGIPFSRFALQFRIKQAARQLASTDDPIKAVAADWGFVDTSHFHKCFKNQMNISPGEYKRVMAEKNQAIEQ